MKRQRLADLRAPPKKGRAKTTKTVSKRTVFRTLPLMRNVGQYTTGFPRQMFMRHKYMQAFTITTGAGALGTFQISANALFDPDNSGATTHQPMYFDQVAALYNKYVVLGSKCTFTFYPMTASTAVTAVVGAYVEDDATISPTTAVACAEQASAQFRVIPAAASTVLDPYQLTNQITLKWDAKKQFGGDVIDNPNLVAANSANPTEQQFYTFFCQDNQATPSAVTVIVVNAIVEYSAQWFELINNAGS